jgi:hypothetical protein
LLSVLQWMARLFCKLQAMRSILETSSKEWIVLSTCSLGYFCIAASHRMDPDKYSHPSPFMISNGSE